MTNYTITPEIREIRTNVRKFMDEHVYPNEEIIEEGEPAQVESLIKDLQSRTKKMGYWAPHMPKEAGGMGIGFMPYVYMNEILGRSYLAPRAFGSQAPVSPCQPAGRRLFPSRSATTTARLRWRSRFRQTGSTCAPFDRQPYRLVRRGFASRSTRRCPTKRSTDSPSRSRPR